MLSNILIAAGFCGTGVLLGFILAAFAIKKGGDEKLLDEEEQLNRVDIYIHTDD